MARMSGLRKSSAQTKVETGLPGRPSTRVGPSLPTISGFPGRMAIFQKSSVMPASFSASCTRSCSPTDAPPLVTRMSASHARETKSAIASRRSGAMPRSIGLAAGLTHERGKADAVGGDDLVRPRSYAGRHKLVAVGEDRNSRASADGKGGMSHRGCERDGVRGKPDVGSEHAVALLEVEAGGPDVASGGDRLQHLDRIAVAPGVLLDQDGVGALRHRCAGEDPDRGARSRDRRRSERLHATCR